ncbi:RbsD/FucU family protein [Pararhizobium antarcticum]|uniref:Ribose ABC transporter n=1 Tax=Pararhizobium antarcticum TaxID=1798805 RepID=A0A657LU62_9HYPH|nr:RbsD/FucU domain-containing protein [Pararhizobium antarcticum]OJF98388.1 ribose ABC transporter [Pararhizobium antarcticum]OJG01094.1 ribose ABC transporter [Rhizobium sp. 58]
MLKGIHPLLGPELLHAIRTMGHGDEIVIADANFPSSTMGPKVVRADGVGAPGILEAILAHMPLDTFVDESAWRMEVVGDATAVPDICVTFQGLVKKLAGDFTVVPIERFAFYERARRAAYIVATTEFQLYGNIILKKGVVRPEELFRVDSD